MSQYTMISKYGKRTRQVKFKKELKHFPSRNSGVRRKPLRTGVEWKLENATPGSMKKATKYGMKIFHGKNLPKLYFDNLVKAKQCKLRQFTHLKIISTL